MNTRSILAHLGCAITCVVAIATLKDVNIDRIDHMLLLGALFGLLAAVITSWWSLAYVALWAAGMVALVILEVPPFRGEYGFFPALIQTVVAITAAIVAAVIVNFCRLILSAKDENEPNKAPEPTP